MLERLGLRPDVAGSGREAVELCALLPYDVIFMDCQMPEMDGYTATAEIRKRQGANARVAVIAMTAEVMEGCRERCIAAGMDAYIAKPVRLDDMIEALKKWVPTGISAAKRSCHGCNHKRQDRTGTTLQSRGQGTGLQRSGPPGGSLITLWNKRMIEAPIAS